MVSLPFRLHATHSQNETAVYKYKYAYLENGHASGHVGSRKLSS